MAKRCVCKALMDVLDEARMLTLPPDTQMLWLRIAKMMQRDGISVLRFGNVVLKTKMIARLVSWPETESETELETKIAELCERGLLAREEDGAVSCPMLAQASTRSEINRINGSKGGRPRKNAVPGQIPLPPMVIKGGADVKTEKTESESKPAETGSLINNINNNSIIDSALIMETGNKVLEAAGIDPVRWMGSFSEIGNWLRWGAAPELICETVREVMARSKKTSDGIYALSYFSAAIKQAIAQQPAKTPDDEKAYNRAYEDWQLLGSIGPAPRIADFRKGEAA